jgi:hypothetical protein
VEGVCTLVKRMTISIHSMEKKKTAVDNLGMGRHERRELLEL